MAPSPYAAREQARWITENASRFIRLDAARFYTPGTNLADVFPALALKYSPNQPRVPAGNPDGGQWTDGEGGAGRLAQPMGRIGITDRRVVSDADPESVRPGEQYAQARGGRGRSGNLPNDLTPAQAARLEIARSRAEDAIARVRVVDRDWKPTPSAYEAPEGVIRAYEADAAQAQARMSELATRGLGPGPFAGESLPARSPERNFTQEERDRINRIGEVSGCNTCGTMNPGTPSGNFVIDHQYPSALNPIGHAQRLFPQCLLCSLRQGGYVTSFGRGR